MTRSRVPELAFLSENECPNSGPDSITGPDCTTGTLTMWGYCGYCWLFPETRIPAGWETRAQDEHMRIRAEYLA